MKIDYEGKTFRSVSNSASGEVGTETVFHYHQHGRLVWAETDIEPKPTPSATTIIAANFFITISP